MPVCGKVGCLEASAGGWALVQQAEMAISGGHTSSLAARTKKSRLTVHDIALAAQAGDALAISLVQKSARIAGESLAAMVNMFNPGVVVLGGAIASAGEVFLAEARQRIYELSLPLATRDLIITFSTKDEREPLRGGAELAREQLFDITFPRWFANKQPFPELIRANN